jgi:hypothetical protein
MVNGAMSVENAGWWPDHDVGGPTHDFAVTLLCGLRVIGDDRAGDWSVTVYAEDGRLLGCGSAPTRLRALEQAGLSSDDAGEVLGRSGI